MITGVELRLARKLLNWPPDRLAKRARVAVGLIVQAENAGGPSLIAPGVARTLRLILEEEGLQFQDDPLRPVVWRTAPPPVRPSAAP